MNQALAGVRARMEQALAHLAGGEAEPAIPLLLSIVDDVPEHGPARLQLGALVVERNEWQLAADHLRAAMAATGPEAPAGAVPVQRPSLGRALLAEVLDQTGDLEGALDATGSALRFAPHYLPALLHRSNLARRFAAQLPWDRPARNGAPSDAAGAGTRSLPAGVLDRAGARGAGGGRFRPRRLCHRPRHGARASEEPGFLCGAVP